jgi:hypothetical protein
VDFIKGTCALDLITPGRAFPCGLIPFRLSSDSHMPFGDIIKASQFNAKQKYPFYRPIE